MSALYEVFPQSDREAQQLLPGRLSAKQRDQGISLAMTIRSSHEHAAAHVINAVRSILMLHGVFGDAQAFEKYCQETFRFSRATVYRYLKAGRAIEKDFLDGDNVLLPAARNISLDVFQLLGADTDPRVIDGIKLIAAEKGKVSSSDAQALLAQATQDYQRQLAEQRDTIVDAGLHS